MTDEPSQSPPDRVRVVLIAAVSREGALSVDGKIPWKLPRDTAYFRARCAGRWLLLGRTTYDQMSGWFQPGHVPLVLTHDATLTIPYGHTVSSVAEAVSLAQQNKAPELIVCGGASVYAAALPWAHEVLLTEVDLSVKGDKWFPPLPAGEWTVVEEQSFPPDSENLLSLCFRRLLRSSW